MTEKEIYKMLNKLLTKIRFTKSKKLKKLYMIDFHDLQEMLLISCNKDITGIEYEDTIIESDILQDELDMESINDFIDLNATTQKLSNETLDTFDKENFAPYYILKPKKYDMSLLHNVTREFVGNLSGDYLAKYGSMLKVGIPIVPIDEYTTGMCFNMFSENKQFIELSSGHCICHDLVGEIETFQAFMHEFAHAIHMDKTNQVGKTRGTTDAFSESLSIMFEKMYLDFLEKKVGIDINLALREEYFLFLTNTIIAKAGTHVVEDNAFEDEYYTIPHKYFSDKYFDKYTYILNDIFPFTKYDISLPYFYGELIATKFMDEFGSDYKNATKELLDILIKLESSSTKEMINEIGLDKVPKGVSRNLKMIK